MESPGQKRQVPEIFDSRRRRALRARAGMRGTRDQFIWHHMAEDISERLKYVKRDFSDILIIGPLTEFAEMILGPDRPRPVCVRLTDSEILSADMILADEDRLPFAPESFDLIITAGTLDSVNDLPGALVQMRRILRKDGLLLANIFGTGTLSTLKQMMLTADGDRPAPHIHPQIDLRNAADLLVRTGFALPVVDQDMLTVRYGDLRRLLSDIRDMGVGNALAGNRPYFGKAGWHRLLSLWENSRDNQGKVEERFNLIHISGWAPSPDQPKPAKRGSATVSMADFLKERPG